MSAKTSTFPSKDIIRERFTNFFNTLGFALPRVKDFLINAVAQVRIYDKAYAGIMHAMIFWGVTTQVIGTAINLMQMQLFIPFVELTFPRGNLYLAFELVMDLAGIAILLGVLMAAFRRLVLRPKTLETRWDDVYALVLLGLIPVAGFTLEATRLISVAPHWANWSPVGNAFARFLSAIGLSQQGAAALHNILIWIHAALGLALLASIPYTKLRHLINTPLNILLRKHDKAGIPEKIDNIEEAELLGVGRIQEFTPRQLLSFDACVRCGRCEEACPASISGTNYSPRLFIQSLRQIMVSTLVYPERANGDHETALPGALLEQTPWSCTTCAACLERCPAFVSPVEEIIDLRRYLALTTGKLPKTVADTLRNMERQGNPWGMPADERIAWTEGLDVHELVPGEETDVLLYLGCASSLDARNRKATIALTHLMHHAGVDFATLGLDETCCGDMARRLGHEYLFQVFAEQLNETLSGVRFKRIVTPCAHCFNALKNEYPQLGYQYPILHTTEFLLEYSRSLTGASPNGNGISGRVIFHDSCYLGRYNQIYEAPRKLLKEAELDLVEFSRNRSSSFCCGGGGGQMWMENEAETRINHLRLQEALDTQASIVATGCPYCLLMFDDAIRSKGLGEQIQVFDIAEILGKQIVSPV
jgi:Fe-S oxidoreductase/nitrate reductase gamma subunit